MAAIARDESLTKEERERAIGWLSVFNYSRELEAICEDAQVDEYLPYIREVLSAR